MIIKNVDVVPPEHDGIRVFHVERDSRDHKERRCGTSRAHMRNPLCRELDFQNPRSLF